MYADADEPIRNEARVVPDRLSNAHDVAPAVRGSLGACHLRIGRYPASFVSELALEVEGVRINNTIESPRPRGGKRYDPGGTCSSRACVATNAA